MKFSMIKEKIKTPGIPTRIIAGLLAVCMSFSILSVSKIESTLADPSVVPQRGNFTYTVPSPAPLPGTAAYYTWKLNEARAKSGFWTTGTYTNSITGASITATVAGPWEFDLDPAKVSTAWNGVAAGTSMGNADTVSGTAYNASTNPYKVTTAEQFRWCLVNHRSFILQNDIDLGGYLNRNWGTPAAATATWTADGNGHTVYNYYRTATAIEQSMFGPASNVTIKNLRISNSYGYSTNHRLSLFVANVTNTKIDGCAAENSLLYISSTSDSRLTSAFMSLGTNVTINDCYTNNFHAVVINSSTNDASCAAQIAVQCDGTFSITNTFAMNGTIVGNKGHNGGFITCCSTLALTIKNCFADVEVYGNKSAGTFLGHMGQCGAAVACSLTVENCFALGKIEGTERVGGFAMGNLSAPTYLGNLTTNIKNCYTTAMTGMMSNATNLGGFIAERNHGTWNLNSCYAAGEVGSLDTTVDLTRTTFKSVGGFVGAHDSSMTYTNCYYDKQTTAMKEWAGGNYLNADYSATAGTSAGGVLPIKGVLTTDTAKSGTGLTSAPGSHAAGDGSTTGSFTGFTNNAEWVFEQDHYPQLAVFANPTTFTNTNWMTQTQMNDLVKAYSRASTSTVKLETWDTGFDDDITPPAALPKTTYDTVRNLTLKFFNTSTVGVSWEKDGSKSKLWNETVDVLYLGKTNNKWYCKDFVPGIEWLTVEAKVNDQAGRRRLRIIPTAALDPGGGEFLTRGNTYDHADEVRLAYSTGPRINASATDITTGIYPDGPALSDLSAYQNTNQALPGGNLGASPPGGTPNLAAPKLPSFLADDNKYLGVYGSHLSRHAGDNADTSKLYVKIFRNVIVDPVTDEVTYTDKIDLDNDSSLSAANADNNDKFNGITPFMDTADTTYLLDYFWVLKDGRYLENGKLLNIKGSPFNVDLYVKNTDGTANSTAMVIDADDPGAPDFSAGTRSHTDTQAIAKQTAQTSWMLTNPNYAVTKLTLQMTYDDYGNMYLPSGDLNESEILDPKDGDTISIKRMFQRKITAEGGGEYYAPPQEVTKTYTIHTGTTAGGDTYFYLTFDDRSLIDGVRQNDIESDIIITLTVEQITTGFEVKKTLESPAEEQEKFVFQVDYREDSATGDIVRTMYAVITIDAGDSAGTAAFVDMPVGWYTVTELDSNWRFELTTAKTVTLEIDEEETFTFRNKRRDVPWVNGKNSVTNEMPSVSEYE